LGLAVKRQSHPLSSIQLYRLIALPEGAFTDGCAAVAALGQ
jgi:hypothetical protein